MFTMAAYCAVISLIVTHMHCFPSLNSRPPHLCVCFAAKEAVSNSHFIDWGEFQCYWNFCNNENEVVDVLGYSSGVVYSDCLLLIKTPIARPVICGYCRYYASFEMMNFKLRMACTFESHV